MKYINYDANIWKFYLYKVFTSLQVTVPIYVLFLLSNNLSMTQVMLLQSFYTLLIFFFEIPSGVFADLYGRKKSLILSSFFLTLAFLVFGLSQTYILFFLAIGLWAIAQSFKSGADQALLFDSLKMIRRTELFAKYSGRSNSLEMLVFGFSAITGGIISNYFGNRILFFLTSILFCISIFVAFSFKEPSFHKKIIEKKYFTHLNESINFSFQHDVVRNFIIFFAFFGSFAYLLYFIIQPLFNQGPHAKIMVSFAVSGYFLFCALGSFVSEKIIKRVHDRWLVLSIVLISAIAFIIISFANIWVGLIMVFINSFIVGVAGILANDKINQNTESYHRATVLSVLNLLQKLIYALMVPFIGYIADVYTLKATFLMVGIVLIIFLLYNLFTFKIGIFGRFVGKV